MVPARPDALRTRPLDTSVNGDRITSASLLSGLRARTARMVADLGKLVEIESPSLDVGAVTRCADVVEELGLALVGRRADRIVVQDRPHLRWRFGTRTRVVLVGHFDTVWPLGTTARWPFVEADGSASGPGAFDMKAGLVQLFYALNALDDLDGVAVVLNSDEELGSPTSRDLIRETVVGAEAALVLEPSANGALKTERKGVSHYEILVTGRAAHAGLDPEKGINAGVELAHQLLAVSALGRPETGTTVTPTLVSAGTSGNSVPGSAHMHVDVRVPTAAEQQRIDDAVHALRPVLEGTSVVVQRAGDTPPMPRSASADLFARAQALAAGIGLPPLGETSVGGGSDGNLIASLGVPTLDGLGAVGDGAHAEGEHVVVSTMPERAALVAALVADLLG